MNKALCLSQNEIDIIIPDARQDPETIQISLWETFRENFRFTLAPKCFSHEQNRISKALFYQQSRNIPCRSELSCGKHSFAAIVFFYILKGPIWSAWSVQVSLTSFMLLTNVAVPAGAAASLALEIHRESPQLIPDCLTPGLSVSHSNYSGQCGHCWGDLRLKAYLGDEHSSAPSLLGTSSPWPAAWGPADGS